MAAAAAPRFMTEAQLQQWIDANPGHANDWDWGGYTPLYAAVYYKKSLPLVLWLLDEEGVDVNTRVSGGQTPLHAAYILDVLNVLLDRGADPTLLDEDNASPLMFAANFGDVDVVAPLLQESRVRAIVDVQDSEGDTALHWACLREDMDDTTATSIVHLLLQANANPLVINTGEQTPSAVLRRVFPTYTTTIALLEQALAATETTSLLVKALRRCRQAQRDSAPLSRPRGKK